MALVKKSQNAARSRIVQLQHSPKLLLSNEHWQYLPMRRFEDAKQTKQRLEADVAAYSDALNRFPKGPTGLTPDNIRATPEWREANAGFQRSFQALRRFNEVYVKEFRAELAAERRARRGQVPNASESVYRGFRIEQIRDAIQAGHDVARAAGTRRPKTRNIGTQYLIHLEDGGSKMVSTMRAAREYIDNYLGSEQTPNASSYYVWVVTPDGRPLASEGPYGPHPLVKAKQMARIGAKEGAHDRAVSLGRSPTSDSFQLVRLYRRRTGERII